MSALRSVGWPEADIPYCQVVETVRQQIQRAKYGFGFNQIGLTNLQTTFTKTVSRCQAKIYFMLHTIYQSYTTVLPNLKETQKEKPPQDYFFVKFLNLKFVFKNKL